MSTRRIDVAEDTSYQEYRRFRYARNDGILVEVTPGDSRISP
jgi:hypothetical protein